MLVVGEGGQDGLGLVVPGGECLRESNVVPIFFE
jgi:hypothetical protein